MKKEQMEQIEQIRKDIEAYQAAIRDAEGALDAAERELDEVLQDIYQEESPEEYPGQEEPVCIMEQNSDRPVKVMVGVTVNQFQMISGKTAAAVSDECLPF